MTTWLVDRGHGSRGLPSIPVDEGNPIQNCCYTALSSRRTPSTNRRPS